MTTSILPRLLVVTAAALAGCASTTPNLDAHFGEAVLAARAAQTINPSASLNKDPVSGVDGQAAKEAMGRYHDSFKTPPPTFNVINVTGGQ
ncbi:MAG: hypothetical protein A2045_17465 [Rhodocyclales bacterium GWA2_65_20]|nr:MAG: hypothetical protein A2045_17465 [Rhodocyclales bacterium GWA2_65_20]